MKAERRRPGDTRTRAALAELKQLVRQRYPDATFAVRRGEDDPDCIHLVATVDVEDGGEVIEAVVERLMEIQIEQGLPIFVIPLRPRESVLAMRRDAEEARGRPAQASPSQPRGSAGATWSSKSGDERLGNGDETGEDEGRR